jgi:hypothetical protein
MNTNDTVPNILTPEFIAQLKKATDEGKLGKDKIESAKKLVAKGMIEKLDTLLKQGSNPQNV